MNIGRAPETKRLIDSLGGVSKTAAALGVSAPAVSKWTTIPKRHNEKILALTGLSIEQLKAKKDA